MRTTLAVLTLLAVFSLTGCSSPVKASETFDEEVAWGSYRRVLVRSHNGRVEVRHAPGETARVAGTRWARAWSIEEAEQRLEQVSLVTRPVDDTLEIAIEAHPLVGNDYGASLQIALPERCAVEVDTGNGAVVVEQMAAAIVDTSNGSVNVRDIDGAVKLDSSNGAMTIEDVAGDCQADTSNGRLTLRNVNGRIEAETSNGRIVAEQMGGASRDIILRSSNGSITATLPRGIAADLEAKTSNGSVEIELGNETASGQSISKKHYKARLNGGGSTVRMTTSNGSIRIKVEQGE